MAGQARGNVTIDVEECKGCGLCVESCPPKCLELAPELSSYGVHPARYTGHDCTGCGICFYCCPEPGAIAVYRLQCCPKLLSPNVNLNSQSPKLEENMRQLCKGNVAVIKGAVLAGCRAYYGYPITPASEVAEAAALYLPEVGGTFVQAESETASINMVYGAASAGVRVMTASSGPGLSLMQEGISYLAGAELPCVIVDVMRGGPGLGIEQQTRERDTKLLTVREHVERSQPRRNRIESDRATRCRDVVYRVRRIEVIDDRLLAPVRFSRCTEQRTHDRRLTAATRSRRSDRRSTSCLRTVR